MFFIKKFNLSNFNTEKEKEIERMFDDCLSIEYLNISNFNINKIYFDDVMFSNCHSLKTIEIPYFEVGNIIKQIKKEFKIEKNSNTYIYNKSQILNVQLKGNNISCCNIF